MKTNYYVLIGETGEAAQKTAEYLTQRGMKVKNVECNPLVIQYETLLNKPFAVLLSYRTKYPKSLCETIKSIESPPFTVLVSDEELCGFSGLSKYIDAEVQGFENNEQIYRILSAAEFSPDNLENIRFDKLSADNQRCRSECSDNERELHLRITEVLNRLGITPKYNGYNYLREAIKLASNEEGTFRAISKEIYPEIASKLGVSVSGVERSIRTAIQKSWGKSSPADRIEFFGVYAVQENKIPTNSEFIFIIADKLNCSTK